MVSPEPGKCDAADETWRLEDPRERHERLQRHEREHRRHTAWLAITGAVLLATGIGLSLPVLAVKGHVADYRRRVADYGYRVHHGTMRPQGGSRAAESLPDDVDDVWLVIADWGFIVLALVPVGLMRLAGACLAPGDPIRRAFSKHPVLKFVAIVLLLFLFWGHGSAIEPAQESGGVPATSSYRSPDLPDVPQDVRPPLEGDWGGMSLLVAFVVVALLLLLLSMNPGGPAPDY